MSLDRRIRLLRASLLTGTTPLPRVALLMLGAAGIAASQGAGYGTAVVVLRSPDVLLAAVDSNENYLLYHDGISTLDRRTVCKIARAGPFYAIVAGIANGTNGFDALRETGGAWQPGDSLDALVARISEAIPKKLIPLLQELYDVDSAGFIRRYRGQAAVQLLLIGAEDSVPQVRIVEFVEGGAAGSVVLSIRTSGCPRDCSQPRNAWFLGTHDRIDEFVKTHADSIGRTDERSLDRLIDLEYEDRPDLVGGPLSMVRVNRAGGTVVRNGACSLSEVRR